MSGAILLGDWIGRAEYMEFACSRCPRRGRLNVVRLVALGIFAIIFIASRRLWVALLLSVVVAGAIRSNAPPPYPITVAARARLSL